MDSSSQVALTHGTASPILWAIPGVAVAVVLLSFFSGFHSSPVPADLAWHFSPLGLLAALREGLKPEYRELKSGSYFSGQLGWTPDYLLVFAKTCALEAPFYYAALRRQPLIRFLAALMALNFATHPLVFFFIPSLFSRYLTSALVSEFFAAFAEMALVWLLLSKWESRSSAWSGALWILTANLFSWELGMYV